MKAGRRRALLTIAACTALAAVPARAQTRPLRRLGFLLLTVECPPSADFVAALAELGWVPGRNVELDCVSAINRIEAVPALAQALVARKPEVIVSGLLPGIRALLRASSTIPVVALGVADPVGQKLIASLDHPGGNLTGLVSVMLEVEAKRIELLKAILPRMTRLAAVYREGAEKGYYEAIDEILASVGGRYGVRHEVFHFRTVEDVPGVFERIAARRVDAVYFPPGPLTETSPQVVTRLALQHRLPLIGQGVHLAEAGALMSYAPDRAHVARRAAGLVDKILRGARPGELPFELPSKFELVINLRTAKALRIAVPPAVLARADRLVD